MDRVPSAPKLLPQVYFPTRPISGFDNFRKEFKPGGASSSHQVTLGCDRNRQLYNGAPHQGGSAGCAWKDREATATPAPEALEHYEELAHAGTSPKSSSTESSDGRQVSLSNHRQSRKSGGLRFSMLWQRGPSAAQHMQSDEDRFPLLETQAEDVARKNFAYSKRNGKRPARALVVPNIGMARSEAANFGPHITRTSPTPRLTTFADNDPEIAAADLPQSREHLVVPSWRHTRPYVISKPSPRRPITKHEVQNKVTELQQMRACVLPASSTDSFNHLYRNAIAQGTTSVDSEPELREIALRNELGQSVSHFSTDNGIERGIMNCSVDDAAKAKADSEGFRPDHSVSGWLQAIFSSLVVVNCWGLNLSYGVFEAYYKSTFLSAHSHSSIAWIGSTQLSLIFLTAIVVGRCYDAGIVRPFFHGGSIGIVVGILGTSWCKTWAQFFWVQGVLLGICMGCVFCSGVLVVMEYFEHRLGIAVAFAAAGSNIGGVVYTVMAQHLLPTAGFARTMRYMGFLALGALIPPNILHKPRRFDRRKAKTEPKASFVFLRNPGFLFMVLGMFLSFWSLYFGFYYIVSYAYTILGLSPTMSINLLIVMLSTNLPGRFLSAYLSDAFTGPLDPLVVSCFTTSAILFLWIGITNTSGLFVLAAFYGFASSGPQALFTPTIALFLESRHAGGLDPAKGLKTAVVFAAIGAACATGTPLGGVLIDRGAEHAPGGLPYLYGQIFAGSAMAGAGICFLLSRVCRNGWMARKA